MDYRDLLPKRDSLNLVKVPHLMRGNVADAHVFPPFLRRLDTPKRPNPKTRSYFFLDLIFGKIWILNGALGQMVIGDSLCDPNPHIQGKNMNKHMTPNCQICLVLKHLGSHLSRCLFIFLPCMWGAGVTSVFLINDH